MIEVDGSRGEGGGQLLRTSLALAALKGSSVRIKNIRASRPNPGLAPQHLAVLKAFKKIFSGRVEGAYLGSGTVLFTPGEVRGGNYTVDIGTAGSVALLAHALLPALLNSHVEVELTLRGGTDTRWAPTWTHFSDVFLYTLCRLGYSVEAKLRRRGFYPRGRGEVVIRVGQDHQPEPVRMTKPGKVRELKLYSYTQNIEKNAGIRMARSAEAVLQGYPWVSVVELGGGRYPRAVMDIVAETSRGCRLGANALGEEDKPVEQVGVEAARNILEELEPLRCVDRHLQDQLIVYMALLGGEILTGEVTSHTKTQIWLSTLFMDDLNFKIDSRDGLNLISTPGGEL